MTVQIIQKDGIPEWAVLPFDYFQQLLADSEMLQDIRDYDEAKRAIAQGEEPIPAEVTYAILDGENPVRVWRQHRRLAQQQLADAAGISTPYLSQIESGKRTGSPEVLSAIAAALNLTLDDIVS
ncbi:MAG: helix-turn-helix transcriptional regulator [Anaerolineae bacterium]|nr:MAG: helix-turn-helix transcriptional regulator [Anaerolineae bacterium]